MYEMDQYTVCLLHFEDGIKDESGKQWAAFGGAATSSDQSKMGSKSLYLAGNQYLSTSNTTDLDFGAGDFTIDWWEYRTSNNGDNQPIFCRDNTISYQAFLVGVCNSQHSNVSCFFSSDNSSWNITGATGKDMGPVILNAWTHYAVVRKGNNFYTFQNGTLQSTWYSSALLAGSTGVPGIGKYNTQGYFPGYIDEFRVSNIARWTSDFDPNPKVGNALLVVTMSDEIQKEYDLSMDEINAFITWYNNRASGTSLPYYIFNKKFNLGPFDSREDYLAFDKIQNFEVMKYMM